MRPRGGISPSFVSEQRIRQLEQKLRAKEERIVVLETENALLHLKLAECQSMIGKSSTKELPKIYVNCKRHHLHQSARSTVIQIYGAIQSLKQDIKNLRFSALTFLEDFQHQSKNSFYQVLAAVQRIQLHNEVMQR
uniref:Uncharacterized protein n=1 Tax=Sphaerodactylus townsendi TaxID=933632 RepID=A0ACB8GBR8_9SAUR